MQDILAACLSLPGCCLWFYSDCVGINYVHKVCRLIFYIHSSMKTKCQSDEYTSMFGLCMCYHYALWSFKVLNHFQV